MAYTNFAPNASTQVTAIVGTSKRVALPGTGATLIVTNIGPSAVSVLLGDNTVVATIPTGMVILPNTSFPLAIGTATNIALISVDGTAVVNLTQGA